MALATALLNGCKTAHVKMIEGRQKYTGDVQVAYRIKNRSIEIFERHMDNPLVKVYLNFSVAKITYINIRN